MNGSGMVVKASTKPYRPRRLGSSIIRALPPRSQVKSSQVKSSQVCHLQITRGPPWDAPGPCLAHAPRRGAHPSPPENGTPRDTHARPRPAVSRWSVSVRRVRAAAGAHTCAARVKSGQARSGQAETGQKIKSNGPLALKNTVTSGQATPSHVRGRSLWNALLRTAPDRRHMVGRYPTYSGRRVFSCFLVTM